MTALAPPQPRAADWTHVSPAVQQRAEALRAAAPAAPRRFHPADVAVLPEPARRWLTHAVPEGTPLAGAMELRTHGEIRLGHWRPFTAQQVIVPGAGFIWAARSRLAGVPVLGYDSYADGRGEMNWRVGGVVPVQSGSGFDVTLSAFDRLVSESVLVPTALVDADWSEGYGRNAAVFTRQQDGQSHWTRVTVWIEPDGRLANVSLWRWGDPGGEGQWGLRRFEVAFDGEFDAGGVLVPDGMRAAWVGTGGVRKEFFRARIDAAVPLAGAAVEGER